jgi:hypothetical protein
MGAAHARLSEVEYSRKTLVAPSLPSGRGNFLDVCGPGGATNVKKKKDNFGGAQRPYRRFVVDNRRLY